jgi:NarL family two-component system response regulator LiaR
MRVLIADDHPLIRLGIRSALEADGYEIVGEAAAGPEVLPLVGRTAPDVVLLDLRMPGIDGLGCLRRITERYPKVRVVVVSASASIEQIEASFRNGACGYVVKGINVFDLPSAIRQAIDGTAYHAMGLPFLNEESSARAAGLTDREITILKALTRGDTNKMIGQELWVTEQTVKFHLTNVYKKIHVANRTEAARWAFSNGLVEPDREDVATA